jgi:hypothetical protein
MHGGARCAALHRSKPAGRNPQGNRHKIVMPRQGALTMSVPAVLFPETVGLFPDQFYKFVFLDANQEWDHDVGVPTRRANDGPGSGTRRPKGCRASRRPDAHTRLRRDARGGDDRIREELAAGIVGPLGTPPGSALTPWCAFLTLCAVSTGSATRRQVPGPASPVTRPGVRIGRAETIDAPHGRPALLERGEAAVGPAMAGAVISAPTAVSTSTRGTRGQG